jgi:hypothetical protein
MFRIRNMKHTFILMIGGVFLITGSGKKITDYSKPQIG